ncbi:MAG: SLBB domain-containing protein, partial [Sediminibacterium sp.]
DDCSQSQYWNNLLIKNVEAADYAKYIFVGGETVTVGEIEQRYDNKVSINGEVRRPGSYGLMKEETLQQLIARAGGIKEDAFANRGYIQRKMPGLNMQMLPFDTKQIINGQQEDILMVKNDSVVIYSSNTFLNNSFVTVNGGVKNPGTYNFTKGMKVEDLIALAGGFTIDAANYKVELSRLEKNTSETLSNQVMGRQKLSIDSTLRTTKVSVALEAFDDVFVPRLLNYRLLGNVKLRGEILYEGDYTLEKRDETVLEVVARAGGITPFASITDIQVFRNGLRVGTDIFNKSMVLQNREPLQLLPGDSIYIPRKNDFVMVRGAVFNEQIVEYNGASFMGYISAVGGTKSNAHLKKSYVQYPNGKYKKTNRFLFMRFYPRITPGSKIFVPEKSLSDMKAIS